MALLGARDMSTIATPPQDRLPIKTIIAEREEGLIKRALMRELARDGQVFVVHNRVETIHEMATHIQKLVPQARVITGHGQMSADELDQVFHLFKSGEADVLVATTIIESGIDIPNANTMIVDRADRFGLADLYQIRGRVGRWNRQAFAYFLTPKRRIVPEIAQKRLDALVDASRGVGGGMKIAMHDLEIRGAGDILGVEQSGQVAAVGFHLYCKLLKRRVDTLRGKMPAMLADTKVEFPVDARLPEEYVNAPSLRMEVYQRLGETTNWEEITEIWDELKDRYGPPPEPAKWLYHITRVRVFASRHNFLLVKGLRATLTVERKMGKKNITKELRLPQIKSPADLEEKVIPLLKSGFGIK
jgi:transcription-repair coupling factor (superfamily II helicase)